MTPRRIRYELFDDGPAPREGDWLETTRSAYLVIAVRVIATRDSARRFSLDVVRYDTVGEEGRRYTFRWGTGRNGSRRRA